jgi:ribosomal protein L11 methyltransferase
MKYIETKVYTKTAGVEPICALLLRHGIEGVSVLDRADILAIVANKDALDWDYVNPDLLGDAEKCGTSGDEDEVLLTFYTGDDASGEQLLRAVKIDLMKLKADEQYGLYGNEVCFGRLYAESSPLSDDWKEKWKEGFRPLHVTERFVVRPPWESYVAAQGEQVIEIDPGMAFGTGSHETTTLCVKALEEAVKEGDRLIDVGAGSGILSIVAILLGASGATAVEIDPDAVRAAAENFARNHVTERIELHAGDIRDYEGAAFDLVVANLTSGLICAILPHLARLLKRDGRLILSGLLAEEADKMTAAIEAGGFRLRHREVKGEWLLLCADFL